MGKIKPGDLIGGRYEVQVILGGKGKSGMGDVFVCLDKERNEQVVLKSFQEKFLTSKFIIDSFKHEALAWIILDTHPNIVRAKYVRKLDKKPYIALEYIAPDEKGRNTLEHYFKEKVALEQVISWGIQLCHAMEYAASRGIISHLDIKPSNIMIDENKVLKLCDFGLARIFDREQIKPEKEEIEDWKVITNEYRPDLSFIGVFEGKLVTGSEKWMAPERFKGVGDIRSDIFSFGAVLHQVLNEGKLPFSEQSLKPYVLSTRKQDEVVIDKVYPIIEKCLQTDPDERYQDFTELRQELEDLYRALFGDPPNTPCVKKELEAFEFENKGISFLTLGLTDMAIRELWKAIEKRPERAETHLYLGKAYLEKGALDIAQVSFNEALKKNPELYEGYINLGDLHVKKEEFASAIQEYTKVLEFDDKNFEASYKIAKTYEKENNLEIALNKYELLLNNVISNDNRYYKRIKKKVKILKKEIKKKKK